ncbi:hypothetical protein [Novosphingobium sp. 9U]|uniref:hypothetical protein n=1 Tax=Novosphingobium sp. 9U TaxID=2653158 RepID=UPI0012F3AB5A|nr:hypothetical protein [Novosphingobium sp. 9U]VWX50884.1 conserved hypothetical protein [Novosphingobium sp. 9U]
MITILAALLGATASCTSVPGADELWQPTTRWVIVGEMHGTNEIPAAFSNLICLAAATKRPVTVALEYPADGQAIIDTYLASNGNPEAQAALLTLPLFSTRMQDGRGSVAFLRLFDTLRHMKRAGQIESVVASDVGRSTSPGQDRDAAMAKSWMAIPAAQNGIVLALVGNLHAMRKPVALTGRTIITAGSLMPARQTVTVNVTGSGGEAWNCQADGCGAHKNGRPHQRAMGITYSTDPDRRWDASYELGVPTTAARPAHDSSNR